MATGSGGKSCLSGGGTLDRVAIISLGYLILFHCAH